MASRSKRKGSQTQASATNISNKTNQHSHLHLPATNNQDCSFDGDPLVSLLNSFQRVIESERQSNKLLPDKLWYKRQFAVGINEVTRLLERMSSSSDDVFATPLQAVLIASDCNPKWLTKHLPSLASARSVPLIFIKDRKEGSLRLGELIKVKTAVAIGVKARGSNINKFVQGVLHHDKLNETGCLDSVEMAAS